MSEKLVSSESSSAAPNPKHFRNDSPEQQSLHEDMILRKVQCGLAQLQTSKGTYSHNHLSEVQTINLTAVIDELLEYASYCDQKELIALKYKCDEYLAPCIPKYTKRFTADSSFHPTKKERGHTKIYTHEHFTRYVDKILRVTYMNNKKIDALLHKSPNQKLKDRLKKNHIVKLAMKILHYQSDEEAEVLSGTTFKQYMTQQFLTSILCAESTGTEEATQFLNNHYFPNTGQPLSYVHEEFQDTIKSRKIGVSFMDLPIELADFTQIRDINLYLYALFGDKKQKDHPLPSAYYQPLDITPGSDPLQKFTLNNDGLLLFTEAFNCAVRKHYENTTLVEEEGTLPQGFPFQFDSMKSVHDLFQGKIPLGDDQQLLSKHLSVARAFLHLFKHKELSFEPFKQTKQSKQPGNRKELFSIQSSQSALKKEWAAKELPRINNLLETKVLTNHSALTDPTINRWEIYGLKAAGIPVHFIGRVKSLESYIMKLVNDPRFAMESNVNDDVAYRFEIDENYAYVDKVEITFALAAHFSKGKASLKSDGFQNILEQYESPEELHSKLNEWQVTVSLKDIIKQRETLASLPIKKDNKKTSPKLLFGHYRNGKYEMQFGPERNDAYAENNHIFYDFKKLIFTDLRILGEIKEGENQKYMRGIFEAVLNKNLTKMRDKRRKRWELSEFTDQELDMIIMGKLIDEMSHTYGSDPIKMNDLLNGCLQKYLGSFHRHSNKPNNLSEKKEWIEQQESYTLTKDILYEFAISLLHKHLHGTPGNTRTAYVNLTHRSKVDTFLIEARKMFEHYKLPILGKKFREKHAH